MRELLGISYNLMQTFLGHLINAALSPPSNLKAGILQEELGVCDQL